MKKTVGDLLREARNKKELALQTISKEIGVSDHHLLAMELDQFALIPENQLDNFLSAYAKAVDLDFSELKQLLENQDAMKTVSEFREETEESIDEDFFLSLDNSEDEETGYRRSRRHTTEREPKKSHILPILLGLLAVLVIAFVALNVKKLPFISNFSKPTVTSATKEEVVENVEESTVEEEPQVKLASQTLGETGDAMSVKITGASAPIALEISFDGTSTGMAQSWIGMTNLKSETTAIMLDSGSTYTDEFAKDAKEVELSFGITEGISIKIAGEELDLSPITSRSNSTITLTIE